MLRTIAAVLLIVAGLNIVVTPTYAQAPDALVVTIRNAAGVGLSEIVITVTDRSSMRTLARATTDTRGVATFADLPVGSLRVVASGVLPGGVQLYQPGDDARGVALELSAPPTRLDLLVEPDGAVLPDPATMITPDLGVPPNTSSASPLPTATPPRLSASMIPATPALISAPAETPAVSSVGTPWWIGVSILLILVAGLICVLWPRARWRSL